jgi:hypothetical protein
MTFTGLGIIGQQRIAKPKELHDSFVLSNILMTFEQVLMRVAIASLDNQSSRPLLGLDYMCHRVEPGDSNDWFIALVRSRNRKVKVRDVLQFRRYVLHFQSHQLRQLSAYLPEHLVIEVPG